MQTEFIWPGSDTYSDKVMLDLFLENARAREHDDALRYFDGKISFGELDRMSDSFASVLIKGGFGPGERVMLYMQNLPHFVVCLLGTWKAGGIVVPVNPMNRAREVALLLADSTPAAIVLTPDLEAEIRGDPAVQAAWPSQAFLVDPREFQTRNDKRAFPAALTGEIRATEAFNTGEKPPQPAALKSEDIAFIVYTSGTTGKPKGVMLTHYNSVAAAKISAETFAISRDSRILAIAPLFHTTGLMQHIGVALSVGCPLVLIHRFNAALAIEAVPEHEITHIAGASTAFIAMMDTPGASPADMESVRSIATGGAPTAPAVLDRMRDFFHVQPMNAYGLTETAIGTHVTVRNAAIPVHEASGALSIGKPNIGMSTWVAAADGEPAPAGIEGEIVVSGPTISQGYWNKPEETAEFFRADGFRTGDIGVMDDDGYYYIIDRKKDMISASGFKIWPRELEDVLYGLPAVREAAVVGVPDGYRGETVKAVISLRDGYSLTIEDITEYCRKTMAAYKRPRIIEIVDELPKNISGKILRRELR